MDDHRHTPLRPCRRIAAGQRRQAARLKLRKFGYLFLKEC